nr:cap specific mRNA [Hymenolepis microstoma]
MAQEDGDHNLLMILIDLTPVWWGTFAHEFLILPTFIENILAFASSHLALSPLNEVAIVGVTPEKTEFLWPSLNPIDKIECRNGQYEPFSIIGQTVRKKVNQMVMSCESTSCTVSFANAINNALCFFIRRCREMRPTFAYTRIDSNTVVEDDIHSLLKDNFHARILVVRAAEDDSSQYLSLMNAVFTAQKMGVLIDACIIPPTRMSYSIEDQLRQSSTTLQESGHSSLFQQAAELTGGIYLRIPRPAGLLQYLLCVFLPHAGLRSQMILPDSNGGSSAGVDFRSACFCHRKMVDLAYLDDTQIGSKGWDLMRKLGWTDGKGLGAQGQGRLEPISTKVPKNRQGLGADAVSGFRALDIGELPNGPNAWSDDRTDLVPASANDDLFYRFSLWFPSGSNLEIPDLPERCLRALRSAILPLDSEFARGPPVDSMESQSRYCSEQLLFEMLFYKNSLDKRSREAIMSARLRSNPYEDIRSGIFMNRAAMKMANMDSLFNGLFSTNPPHKEILHFADICAGPGGFSEYLTWRRGCPLGSKRHHFQSIRGYGMTLKGDCDFKLRKFVAGPVETFRPYYGSADDGDITKWCNLASFAKTIVSATDGKGVHLVMADGGFDVSDGYNLQEVLSKHIYLCQCLCALTILRPGGRFITKLFDTFTDFTVDLLWLMCHVFKKIYVVKPITSRPANSERYLVCDGLISRNDCMAGCPLPPESANKSKKKEPVPNIKRGIHSWPLWPENISNALREIIPDPSNFTKGSLPKHLERSKIIETFKMADLERPFFQPSSFYAFVISGLHSVTMGQTSDPMILLSQGNDRIFTWEEGRFLRLDSKIQLPSGCLLWAINVNIYSNKGRRYRALMILDAAFIYGIDIQHLSLIERMAHIKVLCNTLDFPETECTKVIYPPCRPLTTMQEFINGLKELPCKDYPDGHVMFQATKSGMTCAPKGLLLVQPLSSE